VAILFFWRVASSDSKFEAYLRGLACFCKKSEYFQGV